MKAKTKITFLEVYNSIRKPATRPGFSIKMKTKYSRKAKHKKMAECY